MPSFAHPPYQTNQKNVLKRTAPQGRRNQGQAKDKCNAFTTSKSYMTEKTEPVDYKMFGNVDELLNMTDEEEYALIHSDNDLVKVLHQLNEAGFKPHIDSQVGRMTNI